MTVPFRLPPPKCSLCGSQLIDTQRAQGRQVLHAQCRACGDYSISHRARDVVMGSEFAPHRHLLSGVTRHACENGGALELSVDNVWRLAETAPSARNPLTLLDDLLQLVAGRIARLDQPAQIWWYDYPLLYLRDRLELGYLIDQLRSIGRVTVQQGAESVFTVGITLDGWRRLEELRETRVRSRQAFVAMWFDASMADTFANGFKPALKAAGFDAFRVDFAQHNGKIDDRIIAEIRRSGLLIADFTGHRGGVYFEAGFALGLGIPVVWTCRQSDIGQAHFDTRQYNHITWETLEDLRDKLLARVRATVPGAKLTDDDAASGPSE